MIQNNIRRAEELKKITSSVIKLRAELENINQALQKLIDKEIQEIEEEDSVLESASRLEKGECVVKLRPEQTVKNKLISILDDIEEKLEEMQTEEYQLNTEDYDLNKDLFKLLRLIDMARKELKK